MTFAELYEQAEREGRVILAFAVGQKVWDALVAQLPPGEAPHPLGGPLGLRIQLAPLLPPDGVFPLYAEDMLPYVRLTPSEGVHANVAPLRRGFR